jgi:hypothetical protein
MEAICKGTAKVNKPVVAAVHDDVVVTLTKPIESTVTDTPSRGDEAEWEEQYRKPTPMPLQQKVVLKVGYQEKRGTEEATWMFLTTRALRMT